MDQPDLFDIPAGKAGKKDGMRRVEENANEAWKREAARAAFQAAKELDILTADDVHERIGSHVATHELRALGPVMTMAAKSGWIRKAEVIAALCRRPSRHRGTMNVWKSLLR